MSPDIVKIMVSTDCLESDSEMIDLIKQVQGDQGYCSASEIILGESDILCVQNSLTIQGKRNLRLNLALTLRQILNSDLEDGQT